MKSRFLNSIRSKLATIFVLVTATTLIIVLSISYLQQVKIIEKRSIDKLTAIRDLKMAILNQWFDDKIGDILIMSNNDVIRELDYPLNNNSPINNNKYTNAKKLLSRFLKHYQGFEEFFIINANDGLVLLSTKESEIGGNKTNNLYFTEPIKTQDIYIKDIYFSNLLNKPTMTISIPIYCKVHNKHIVGVLVGRINLDESLYPVLSNTVGLGETGETLIVNEDVIAINKLRWYNGEPLNLKISAKPAINAAAGLTGTIVTNDYRNESVMGAYAYLPKLNWGFVCKQDIKEINAPISQIKNTYLIILIITLIIIFFVSRYISKLFTNPIINMNKIARRISSGDYNARNNSKSDDEFGSLANEFDNMATEIQSKINIQTKVATISETIISHTKMIEFAKSLLKQIMTLSEGDMSVFYVLNEVNQKYECLTSINANIDMIKPFNSVNPEGEIGTAVNNKSIIYHKQIPNNSRIRYNSSIGEIVAQEIITIPIIYEDITIALISIANINKFPENTYEVLRDSWAAINSSYANLLANERTKILAEQLTRINQQLEAQAEELQEQSEELQNQSEELQITSKALQKQNIDLEEKQIQIESANKLKSEFLSNMSHELRTPLNSVLALSKVLIMKSNSKLNQNEKNYLKIIEKNGYQLLKLINNILDLSKIEAGKIDLAPDKISIKNLLINITESIKTLAESKGLQLTNNIADNLPFADTDESKLYQVILNIVGNAVKFTEKGYVNIEAKNDNENIYITVTDTGIGISKEMIPYIFDEFRQADGTTSRSYEGTGLGLAIAKKIITIIGGEIRVKSSVNQGSTFTVSVPIKWKFEKLDNPAYLESNLVNKPLTIDPNNNRILIVEDNEDAIIQINSAFENKGYIIDIALNGREALEYLSQITPAAVVLDIMLPEISGFKVLQSIRNNDKTKNIPVIILTAKDLSAEEKKTLKSLNISQLFYKGDVNINKLINVIKNRPQQSANPIPKKISNTPKPLITPSILVIEDNTDNMTTIRAILGKSYKIHEYYDGNEGLKATIKVKPDILLLDISLPGISGIEVMKNLKSNPETSEIPVIAVTAQAMKGDKEALLKDGFDGYISKPINPDSLIAEINYHLKNTNK